MHIAHTEASLGWGGQEIRILTEAAGMLAHGHRVTLLCPPEARIHAEAAARAIPALALPARATIIGIVATLRSWKGHISLIDAFAGLRATTGAADLRFAIVGDGPQFKVIQQRVAQRGLTGTGSLSPATRAWSRPSSTPSTSFAFPRMPTKAYRRR